MIKEILLKEATEYIEAGISLIPVGMDKKPLIPWREFQERRVDISQVEKWYDELPGMQLGIVTGKISNLIVVDIENGGEVDWLPKTAIAKTGGDGFHYYYSYVPGMTNKVRIRNLTDIRSDGGYVIAPPSETTKGKYEWIVKSRPIMFPKNLFVDADITPDNYTKMETNYPGYGSGQRNNEMARYIGFILAKVHPSEWDTIGYQMISLANQKNTPPLSDYELRNTFDSIANTEKRNNQDRWYKREENKKENESNIWKEEDNKILSMKDIASMEQYLEGDKYETRFPLFDAALGGGLEDGDLIIVSGLTGMGKTTFSQQIAVNFAEQGLPVMFLSYEVKVSHLWNKFKEMGMDDTAPIYSVQRNTTGNTDWIEKKLIEAKENFDVKLLVIDHLGFLLPKAKMGEISQNYSVYIGQICRELKQVALRNNIVIVMPVHLRKTEDPGLNDLGNSSAIGQESDAVIIVNREKNPAGSINVYQDSTKIMMVKNRKTGQSVQGHFKMVNGRFKEDDFYIPPLIDSKKTIPWKQG